MAASILNRSALLRFAGALFVTNLKATTMLRGAFVMQVLFMALNNATFFVFWWALMARVPVVDGWRLADVQVLFGIVAVAFGIAVLVAGGVRHLGRFIDEGELDTLLTQPKPALLYAVGLRSQPSGGGDVLSGIVFIALSDQVSWHDLPLLVLVIASSTIVLVATGVIFFSLAFWLGSVETLSRQLWDMLIMFSLYPEPLFGGAVRLVLFTLLPAGFVAYVPVRLMKAPTVADALLLAAMTATYAALAVAVFDRGLRRYSSGSRFGTFG